MVFYYNIIFNFLLDILYCIVYIRNMKTKEEINEDIRGIFNKHGIQPLDGLDGFWDAVEDVTAINPADGHRLARLGNIWERT